MSKVVIIGNGIAGVTAARHIRKLSNYEITIVSSESRYFFSRTALMYVYMGHMKFEHTQPYEDWFWKKNKINLLQAEVTRIDKEAQLAITSTGETLPYDKLILALGSRPRKLAIPGVDLKGIQSLYHKQDLELMEESTLGIEKAMVIGGGLIGVEMAEMLHSRGIEVTMLVRESQYWNGILPNEEASLITKHIESRGIHIELGTTAVEFKGGDRIESIIDSNNKIHHPQFVGITVGVEPNKDLAEQTGITTNKGVVVDESLATSTENIYAIGDCAEIQSPKAGRKPIEAVWYTGRIMGETVAQTITGNKTSYNPGVWFNSAKFFDLEYQTYGTVPNSPSEKFQSYYWEDSEFHAIRLVYNEMNQLEGVNAIGIRLRHELCDKWISEKKDIESVLEKLEQLNFDPEFSTNYLKLARTSFRQAENV